jgi:hypothetical protein
VSGARGLRTLESRDTCGRPRGNFSWGSQERTRRRRTLRWRCWRVASRCTSTQHPSTHGGRPASPTTSKGKCCSQRDRTRRNLRGSGKNSPRTTHQGHGSGPTHRGKKRTPPWESSGMRQVRSSNEGGLRLQDGYLTHMAELYALGCAIKSVPGQRGMDINFVTDSRVVLDMLTKRRRGTEHAIHKELKRIEDEGSTVKLWWSSDQHKGIAEADKIAKKTREKPEEFLEERSPITARMLKKEAT